MREREEREGGERGRREREEREGRERGREGEREREREILNHDKAVINTSYY